MNAVAQLAAYTDPEHDVKHLKSVYRQVFEEGLSYQAKATYWKGLADERFHEADRINEQLQAARVRLINSRGGI